MSAPSLFPVAKPHLRIPRLGPRYDAQEIEKLLDELNRVWEERDRQIASHLALSSQAANIMEWGDGVPVNDGIQDATDTFKRAFADTRFSWFYVPTGTYLMDQVAVSRSIHLFLADDAVLKLRTVDTAVDANTAILDFVTGSNGSHVVGGVFDGNRAVHDASFPAGQNNLWMAIRVRNDVDHFTLAYTTIQNFTRFACRLGGDYQNFDTVKIINCGNGLLIQQTDHSSYRHILQKDISLQGLNTFQHANEIRDCVGATFEDWVIEGYVPEATGLDPVGFALDINRMSDSRFRGFKLAPYGGGTLRAVGFAPSAMKRCHFTEFTVHGYHECFRGEGFEDSVIADFVCDSNYNQGAGDSQGMRISSGGYYPQGPILPNAIAGSRNVQISNGLILRAKDGLILESGNVEVTNVSSIGNTEHGIIIRERQHNTAEFPNHAIPRVDHVILNACKANFNAGSGIVYREGLGVIVNGGNYTNNGQDTTIGGAQRTGICTIDGNTQTGLLVSSVRCGDTQTWTKTDGASYIPGATVGNRFTLTLVDPDEVNLGQMLTFVNAVTGPANVTAKVVDMYLDEAIIETSGAFTFIDRLVALTGTWSSTGTTVNGDAGGAVEAADTEILGHLYVKSPGGQYRRVIDVNGANQFIIDSAFTPDLAVGTTLNKVVVDVLAIQSQVHGVRLGTGLGGRVLVNGMQAFGVTTARITDVSPSTEVRICNIQPGQIPAVTAAASTNIPRTDEFVQVGGNTVIVSTVLMAAGVNPFTGMRVKLLVVPNNGQTITFDEAGNMRLNNNQNFAVVGTAGGNAGVLELLWNGSVFIEWHRSVDVDNTDAAVATGSVP